MQSLEALIVITSLVVLSCQLKSRFRCASNSVQEAFWFAFLHKVIVRTEYNNELNASAHLNGFIFLNARILSDLSTSEIRAVLYHELGHIRQQNQKQCEFIADQFAARKAGVTPLITTLERMQLERPSSLLQARITRLKKLYQIQSK